MKKLSGIVSSISLFIVFTSFHLKNFTPSSYYIVIDKSKYELSVVDGEGWLVTYPVVFGNNDIGDKMIAGDRKTPEGLYTLVSKRVDNRWDRFLALDYPTQADYSKFVYRKQH